MADSSRMYGKITQTTLPDGTVISVNDHVYLASEFTGESYYIGRVMEFGKPIKGKTLQVRIGWFYRPKDVMASRRNFDPRLLIATMHSDMNPVTSIRGRCVVTHQAYIRNLDEYKALPDHFYYNQLFDRYIHRFYEVIPVESVRNLPQDVAEELSRRYQFIVVEMGTGSEYTDAHRVCQICKRWCANGEALKCIMCQGYHHMLCMNPPMLRKPSKGFAFQCALCTKLAMESSSSTPGSTAPRLHGSSNGKEAQSNNNTNSSNNGDSSNASSGQNSPRSSPMQKSTPIMTFTPAGDSPSGTRVLNGRGRSTRNSGSNSHAAATPVAHGKGGPLIMEQKQRMSHLWPFRYFGTHADIRDIFDPDDRVYPRAASRVGTRYQAYVMKWERPGQILPTSTIFDDPKGTSSRGRSRRSRGGRFQNRLRVPEESENTSRAASVSLEGSQDGTESGLAPPSPSKSGTLDEPVHVERGGDDTSTLLYSKPDHIDEQYVSKYLDQIKDLQLPLPSHSADLIDRALLALQNNQFDADKALDEMAKVTQEDFDLRDWTVDEIERFEEGIRVYGHELHAIKKQVGSRSMKDIVRFFYQWKKTERYQPVYSVFTKINKPNKKFKSVGRAEVTSPTLESHARHHGRSGVCAPVNGGDSDDDNIPDNDSLIWPNEENKHTFECAHCGATKTSVWRRAPGEAEGEQQTPRVYCNDCGNDWVRYVTLPPIPESMKEGRKGRSRDNFAKNQNNSSAASPARNENGTPIQKRKRGEGKLTRKRTKGEYSQEPTRSPSPIPDRPCAVCNCFGEEDEVLLRCQECYLTVHHDCYGVPEEMSLSKSWQCDTCLNNLNPTVSTTYKCVLCSKTSCKENPQALKRTTGNNWAHILCAVWIPEVKVADVNLLSPIESIGKIRQERWKQICSICKERSGACITCSDGCKRVFHVSCARDAGYEIAFEMQPAPKSTRGGLMVPVVLCPQNHSEEEVTEEDRKLIHIRDQPDAETDLNALMTYVRYYKQCDTSVSSAMRKCRLLMSLNPGLGSETLLQSHSSAALNGGGSNGIGGGHNNSGHGGHSGRRWLGSSRGGSRARGQDIECLRCHAHASPIWWDDPTALLSPSLSSSSDPMMNEGLKIKREECDMQMMKEEGNERVREDGFLLSPAAADHDLSGSMMIDGAMTPRSKNNLVRYKSLYKLCHRCHWEMNNEYSKGDSAPNAPISAPNMSTA
ncbi:putative PHD type zinc finger protein with BAH domain-containing protein [Actinomortierella wolfii]|nr:putative PHD type zinc finger protein with BAH domain-containing protein [Actinomortierella wolfii]